MGFRLREKGLTDAEIISKSCGIGTTRRWLNSLDRLLSGTRPTSKSAAKDTSYAYRELFNHPRSDDLDRYERAWLNELKAINPDDVSLEPLKEHVPTSTEKASRNPNRRDRLRSLARSAAPVTQDCANRQRQGAVNRLIRDE